MISRRLTHFGVQQFIIGTAVISWVILNQTFPVDPITNLRTYCLVKCSLLFHFSYVCCYPFKFRNIRFLLSYLKLEDYYELEKKYIKLSHEKEAIDAALQNKVKCERYSFFQFSLLLQTGYLGCFWISM